MTDHKNDPKNDPNPTPKLPADGPLHGQRDLTKPDNDTTTGPAVPAKDRDALERGGGTREK